MVEQIFETLGQIATGFANLLVSLFESVVSIFYVPASGTGSDAVAAHLTIVGILMLVGLGTGLVIWAFKYIRSLIRVRTK